ncbi:DUF2515 domain-containing protein [Bacillus sp. V3B]|uniref:DUF2515 domain-containing protein n=1 Tax=Bacillus sp. V3B TaxID=2804915 RepID=UPI00210C604E|nr:DUF2515 domain-containing protein [Bacillus sp. V3B]MCQ6276312.1 DUF2515 domain-containing protein [Bacillus sp. V3B]
MFYKFMKQKKLPLSESLIKIKKELKKKSKKHFHKIEGSAEEKMLVQQIKDQTTLLNKNNVTRTRAYLAFYHRHPEIHWAFLGHMVSRNGGWNMTDLKGGLLSRLLTQKERISFFEFLERGNWLIFQDAFPQFLVYEESIKRRENLFYLLPHLHVSIFMETIWDQFWEEQDSYILTVALIINEQSYLESRVLKNPAFKKDVFNTLEFKLQDFLSMNHILFPYLINGKVQLVGQTLHHFESLHERILLGKRLYSILFGNPYRLKMMENWANNQPHSGSRKDYWPHIFNDINERVPGKSLKPRIKSCKIVPGSSRIYSPRLEFAWKNKEHKQAEITDWYQDWKVIEYLINSGENVDGEIEDDYCKTLERLEFAAITKKTISLLD